MSSNTVSQDGKPYIVSLAAGPANPDARSQGFTVVAKTEFKSQEDFEFYDGKCEAHNKLKESAKEFGEGAIQGMMMVYYTPEVSA